MRVVQINGGVFGSTGRIMFGISDVLRQNGDEALCFSPVTTTNRYREPENEYIKIGTFRSRQINVLFSRLTGYEGCFAYFATRRMLKTISEFKPDIIHLHNIHGGFVNLPMLFKYIKRNKIKTVWTLHDCWSFTGHCPHFISIGCEKWKSGCNNCPLFREYPQSFFDNSKKMYRLKKKWFNGIEKCTLVTPSNWLAGMVNQSFLSRYRICTVNNGIDPSVFKPSKSDLRQKHNIEDKKLILGVSFVWNEKKGLDIFKRLASELSDDYVIVLVGTDENVEKDLPKNIITLRRTQNQSELAGIYSTADVFVNPTREDTFPTVNIESLACGTPVVTFNTGGSVEIIDPESGITVDTDDYDGLKAAIVELTGKKAEVTNGCVKRSKAFLNNEKSEEYRALYYFE